MPYCYDWPRPAVTSDVCALSRDPAGEWHVLLIRRANPPFAGMNALPGGFLDVGREDVLACARRELKEETGIEAPEQMHLLGVWSDPRRDPRGHVVTPVWLALFDWPPPRPTAGDDAAAARWLPVRQAAPLAFDHADMLKQALALAGRLVSGSHRR
jgi:8-oxo-dGTP diphosphatase